MIKPFEFMNLSGNGVSTFLRKNGITPSRLLVVHDEIDFEFAKCKMKIGGGHAGHNGLRDIIAKIGTADFHRLRVGVAKPLDGRDVADYVLSKFTSEEKTKLNEVIDLERWPLTNAGIWTGRPRFDKKGFHLHTMHPLELAAAKASGGGR